MLTTIKVYACYAVKIYKKQTQQIFKRGGARPICQALADSSLKVYEIRNYFISIFLCMIYGLRRVDFLRYAISRLSYTRIN